MVSEAQRRARARFVRLYAKGKKGTSKKNKTKARTSKGAPKMARKNYKKAYKNFVRRRYNVIPFADGVTAYMTIDGATQGNLTKIVGEVPLLITGKSNDQDKALKNIETHAKNTWSWASKNVPGVLLGALKGFAMPYLIRKGLGFLGVPRTIKLVGKTRLQLR